MQAEHLAAKELDIHSGVGGDKNRTKGEHIFDLNSSQSQIYDCK